MINHTFVNARFIDTKHTVCEVLWRDNDDALIIRSENVLREDGNTLWENLLKETTLEKILKNTFDYNKGEEEAFKKMFKKMYDKEESQPKSDSLSFEKLLSNDLNQEELFKLKILIFENEAIKESKDRSLKTKIRKSKDALEIINLYYNATQTSS